MNGGIVVSSAVAGFIFSDLVQESSLQWVVSGAWLWSVPVQSDCWGLTAHTVKHLPEVVEVKSSLYLKLIRLDNKFNFIAIFSLTVKIQYFSPPLPSPSLPGNTMVLWVGQSNNQPVSMGTCSCCAPRPKFGKTDYMEFWNNNKNFKLGKIREMSGAGREADW